MSKASLVIAAMSGGVDSAVAAALLIEQGFQVIGVTQRMWQYRGSSDTSMPDIVAQSEHVCKTLDIPFRVLDVRAPFAEKIVHTFIQDYINGKTPSPCLHCNRLIKWGELMRFADQLGVGYLATGHYARLLADEAGQVQLLRAVDKKKDQSYMLSLLSQEQLRRTIFPLGGLTKPDVRRYARQLGLAAADREESQDICFLPDTDYREFLQAHSPEVIQPGDIVNSHGDVLGTHQGLAFYTIGQRKGLGLAAPKPLYVLRKEMALNQLVVGFEDELGQAEFTATDVNWIAGRPPADRFAASVKIRYQARPAEAVVSVLSGDRMHVTLQTTLRDVTPGQVAVLYQNEVVLGGGVIGSF